MLVATICVCWMRPKRKRALWVALIPCGVMVPFGMILLLVVVHTTEKHLVSIKFLR